MYRYWSELSLSKSYSQKYYRFLFSFLNSNLPPYPTRQLLGHVGNTMLAKWILTHTNNILSHFYYHNCKQYQNIRDQLVKHQQGELEINAGYVPSTRVWAFQLEIEFVLWELATPQFWVVESNNHQLYEKVHYLYKPDGKCAGPARENLPSGVSQCRAGSSKPSE